jgi:hypothetical protein
MQDATFITADPGHVKVEKTEAMRPLRDDI